MKRILSLLLCLCLFCSLAGCSGYKRDKAFTYILPGNITTLDPQSATGTAESTVIDSLFEGLCRVSKDGEALPGVAEKWDVNDSFTQFTFRLRGNAKWSDSTPVTADDFLYGFQRALTPRAGTTSVDDLFVIKNARAIYNGQASMDTLGVRVENDRTLVVELEESYADFPLLTAGLHYMPCNRTYFEKSNGHYGLSSEYLISNGPFTLDGSYAWQTDSGSRSVSLARSDTYKGGHSIAPSYLTYLIDYKDSIDKDPITALTGGDVDVLQLPEALSRTASEKGCGVEILEDATLGLLFNTQATALQRVETRKLFFQTIDRQSLLSRRSDESTGTEASGIMPACVRWNGEPYYADGATVYTPQDDSVVDTLPSLLSVMKWDKLPGITVLCPNDEESVNIANGLLISWNSKLGNAFNILPLSEQELRSRVASGDYEAALYTLHANGATPYDMLKAFESTASPTLLKDEAFDTALHAEGFDLAAYRELENLLEQQYVFYPLLSDSTYFVTSPSVKNIAVAPDHSIDFSEALKKE